MHSELSIQDSRMRMERNLSFTRVLVEKPKKNIGGMTTVRTGSLSLFENPSSGHQCFCTMLVRGLGVQEQRIPGHSNYCNKHRKYRSSSQAVCKLKHSIFLHCKTDLVAIQGSSYRPIWQIDIS